MNRLETEYQELKEMLEAKTAALEQHIEDEFQREEMQSQLTKCERLLSQKEAECEELKKALGADRPENAALVTKNIELMSRVRNLPLFSIFISILSIDPTSVGVIVACYIN
jgi:hypothetical protein